MKKKMLVLSAAVLLAAMLALSGAAQAAMWAGVELGGNFPTGTTVKVGGFDAGSASFYPSVIGGATIGYDFVNAGFGGYAWPDWMKYFSFAMDITYNRLNPSSLSTAIGRFPTSGTEGYALAWTFLFMAHYGFMPDSEVPSGRINPYIGVGPAIVWSGVDFGKLGIGNRNATNVALVVEPGIRWMCFKNVSVDTAFRWRYCSPSYSFDRTDVRLQNLNQLSFLVRANYHF
jgi:hypothetical protein